MAIPNFAVAASAAVQQGVAFASITPASKLPDAWQVTTAGNSLAPQSGFVPAPTGYRPLKPQISWPGAISCVNVNYTNSHGISPGVAVLTLNPQSEAPDVFGNLLFGDALRPPMILRDCHMDHLEVNKSTAGSYFICQISDRRWRWQQGYPITGEYNRLDNHGNFVPWTVQSAKELAEICLKAMGEKRYVIAFPPGLTHKQSEKYDRILRAGERFPLTYANPYVLWDNIPAAVALQQLADRFGCRVMYDPISDRVAVLPVGYGSLLPYGGTSVNSASQGITASRLPKYLEVVGANIKFQMRLRLESAAEEYDGFFTTPITNASYAPIITQADSGPPAKEAVRGWDRSMPPDFPNVEPTDRLEYTEAQGFARRSIYRAYRIAENKETTIAGKTVSVRNPAGIDVSGKVGIRVPGLRDAIVTGSFDSDLFDSLYASAKRNGLDYDLNRKITDQPIFNAVNNGMFEILQRRQQIILTMEKVEQNKPRPRRDTDIVREPNRPNSANDPGSLPDYYNGYSRDRIAECFGTYYRGCSQVIYNIDSDIVTKRRIYLTFSVNSYEQLVIFTEPLYTLEGPRISRVYKPAADLFIETGVLITDPNTNYPYRCRYRLELGGEAPGISEMHEDIITHIVGEYDDATNNLTGYRVDDFGDGKARAKYYLEGMRRRFQNWQSQTVTYNGCMLVSPSGSVQQIQWQVGVSGIKTTAGVNTEFSPNIPPYPERKLPENLPPNEQAKMLNRMSAPQSVRRLAGDAGGGPVQNRGNVT